MAFISIHSAEIDPRPYSPRCRFCLDTGKAQGGFCECDWGHTLLDEAAQGIQAVIDASDDWSGSSEVDGPDFVLKSEVECPECGVRSRQTSLSANPDETWTIECSNCLATLGVKR